MKHDLRVAVTKRMIKEGLLQLLEEKTLEKIRINELCEKAGVNRATFYRHYNTPQDVLREIGLDFVKQIPKFDRPPQTLQEARFHLEAACTFVYEHSDVAKLILRNSTDEDMMFNMDQHYRTFLELRNKENAFPPIDEDTAGIVIAMIGGGCRCLLRKWILEDIPKTPGQIAAIMSSVIRWPSPADFLPKDTM